MIAFDCLLPRHVSFGSGTLQKLAAATKGKTVLVLSDAFLRQSGVAGMVADICHPQAASVSTFTDIPAEPTEDQVSAVVAALEALPGGAPQVMVAVGGGSVMDMAKFAAVMLHGGPSMEDLFAGRVPEGRTTELIMAPTTAGTGAEATPNAIALRPALNLKVGVVCPAFVPDHVILDPQLTAKLPPKVTAATGLDALCHALECYISNKANPISNVFAKESARLIFRSLRTCYHHGENMEARGDMLLAAFYAGICIAAAGTTAVHALSYPLGGRYRIAHGVSNAMLLAPVFRFHQKTCRDLFASIAPLTGKDVSTLDAAQQAALLIDELESLAKELGIPATLSELGIPAEHLNELTDAAFEVKRLLNNNPVPLSKDDIRAIYTSIL